MKLTKISKKTLSLLISAIMLLTSLPMPSFAQLAILGHFDPATGESVVEKVTVETQEDLQRLLTEGHPMYEVDEIFGPEEVFAKHARVQAEEAKEVQEVVTVLADGFTETRNVANVGDYIVTNPGGERYVIKREKFLGRYEPVAELGEGWYRPKWAVQKFREVKADVLEMVAPWGERQVLRKGARVNVTNVHVKGAPDLYGVAADEFNATYSTVKKLFAKSCEELKALLKKVGGKLPKESVLYKRFLAKGTTFTKKQIAQAVEEAGGKVGREAGEEAGKNIGKKLGSRALKTVVGTILGIGLYATLTYLTTDTVQAQNIPAKSRREIIRDINTAELGDVEDLDVKTDILENMYLVLDANSASIASANAAEGNGDLIELATSIMPTLRATGLNDDQIAEVIAKQVQEDKSEVQIPFVLPDVRDTTGLLPTYNFNAR